MKPVSAEQFKTDFRKSGCDYSIPFKLFDDTLGGQNLGRIEFQFEPHYVVKKNRPVLKSLFFIARQTYDKKISHKLFNIETISDTLAFDRGGRIWITGYCQEHKRPFFRVYPDDDTNTLEITILSTAYISFVKR